MKMSGLFVLMENMYRNFVNDVVFNAKDYTPKSDALKAAIDNYPILFGGLSPTSVQVGNSGVENEYLAVLHFNCPLSRFEDTYFANRVEHTVTDQVTRCHVWFTFRKPVGFHHGVMLVSRKPMISPQSAIRSPQTEKRDGFDDVYFDVNSYTNTWSVFADGIGNYDDLVLPYDVYHWIWNIASQYKDHIEMCLHRHSLYPPFTGGNLFV